MRRITGCGRSAWRRPTSAKDPESPSRSGPAPRFSARPNSESASGVRSSARAPVCSFTISRAVFSTRRRGSGRRARAQRDSAFQRRQSPHDDRSALDFFLDGGHVYVLARPRAQSEFFLVLAGDRSARRARISLQVSRTPWSLFPSCSCWRSSRRLRREFKRPGLYLLIGAFALCTLPADHLERATRLDHAGAFAFAGKSGSLIRLSSALSCSDFSPPIFSFFRRCFFWGSPGLSSRIGGAHTSNSRCSSCLVWSAGLCVLPSSVDQQEAAPNWDALAFFGFGLVATYFWRERVQTSVF